jgi:putative peptidoglycan lipid II flippase
VLARTLGGIGVRSLVRFLVRLVLVAVLSTTAAVGAAWLLRGLGEDPALVVALLRALAVTAVDVVVFLLLARLFRLQEVTAVLDTVARRLPSRSRG